MAKIFLIVIVTVCLGCFKANAQYGFSESAYYQQRYSISDVPIGQPYYKYNYMGQPIGVFQQWQYANWQSASGGHYVSVWTANGWQNVWYSGTYWWYNWVIYEKRIQ